MLSFKRVFLCLSLVVDLCNANDFPSVDGHTFSDQAQALINMTQGELDHLFTSSEAGPIPNGRGYGMIMLHPSGSKLNLELWELGKLVWQGKVFDTKSMTGINVILGQHLVKCTLSKRPGVMDQKESIALDFSTFNKVPPLNKAFDEFRQIGDRLYLGRMYIDSEFVLNFALEWAETLDTISVPPAHAHHFPKVDGHTFSDQAQSLMDKSQAELDTLFKTLEPGPVPDGRGFGMIMLAPVDAHVDMALWELGKLVWQGKVFDRRAMTGINVIFEQLVVKGKLSVGKSAVDGGQSLLLDFGAFSKLPPLDGTHDELRQVCENLYLGRMYIYGHFILNFALEFEGAHPRVV